VNGLTVLIEFEFEFQGAHRFFVKVYMTFFVSKLKMRKHGQINVGCKF